MKTKKHFFEKFANAMTQFTGTSTAFSCAAIIVLAWAISGPFFDYSETWQLVINTGTTIVTFLMVFLIQKSQNKDSKAIQLKLNELLAAKKGASNRMVCIEDLSEEELDKLNRFYKKLAQLEAARADFGTTHSIDAAEAKHHRKYADEVFKATEELSSGKHK
ncbi:low affinity iron permease family protein [Pelobium manganitolerans]|uniref:low affinity iron permease family protein n=1 Tax=Pelobium manganitolerans TaxID=1842495 RepID=UPI003FA3980B